jgi:ABC-type oligopeptide transport system ATPase subunit
VSSETYSSNGALLTVENLEKHFPIRRGIIWEKTVGAVKAVDGVTFEVGLTSWRGRDARARR